MRALTLYQAHRSALVDYADSIVRDRARAEDVVQEAWLRIADAESQRLLHEPLAYFYRVVRNLALDGVRVSLRETRRRGGDVAEVAETLADDAPSPERQAATREELRIVLASMAELPERTRLALTLHGVEGLKLREIAERLGISTTYTHQLIAEGKMHCIKRLRRRG